MRHLPRLAATLAALVLAMSVKPAAAQRPSGGTLPPKVIQRVVAAAKRSTFRRCFENGLRNCPNLQGRVAVRFVIGRSGRVTHARDGGSDLVDKQVIDCVVAGFRTLEFPRPRAGTVTVIYPIAFAPGE